MSVGVYLACDDCMERCDAATLRGGHFCNSDVVLTPFIADHSNCMRVEIYVDDEKKEDEVEHYTEWTKDNFKELKLLDRWGILYDIDACPDYSVMARYQTFFIQAIKKWCIFDGGDGERKVFRLNNIEFDTKEQGDKFCTVHNLAWAATLEATNNQAS